MFKYYKSKHSDLMIKINSNKHTIINLHGDDKTWRVEEEKPASPVITRFDTYEETSEIVDESENETEGIPSSPSETE